MNLSLQNSALNKYKDLKLQQKLQQEIFFIYLVKG